MLKCTNCGVEVITPSEKCPRCFLSGTFVIVERIKNILPKQVTDRIQKRLPSGFSNFDPILGGGLVTGSINSFAAAAGIGKSTFNTQIAAYQRKKGFKVYYFNGEETPELVNARSLRLGISEFMPEMFYRKEISELGRIVRRCPPDVLIVDSIQSLLGSQTKRLSNDALLSAMLQLRNLTEVYNIVTCLTVQINKDLTYSGPQAISHYSAVFFEAKRGNNDEVIFTTTKNRFGSINLRAVFRMTGTGLVELDERETGYILRHQTTPPVGLAAYMTKTKYGPTVDEITVAKNVNESLMIDGCSKIHSSFLLIVIQIFFPDFQPDYIVTANLGEKLSKNADLAIVMALLSIFYNKPIQKDTIFIASVDAFGNLLPVPDMGMMVQRAKVQGYSRVIGAVPIGSQQATWETAKSIKDVWDLLDPNGSVADTEGQKNED